MQIDLQVVDTAQYRNEYIIWNTSFSPTISNITVVQFFLAAVFPYMT